VPHVDPQEVEREKQIGLLAYLEKRKSDELVKIGVNTYSTKTHDLRSRRGGERGICMICFANHETSVALLFRTKTVHCTVLPSRVQIL
jgi:hypothetical protein